jgi:hypothetical protein
MNILQCRHIGHWNCAKLSILLVARYEHRVALITRATLLWLTLCMQKCADWLQTYYMQDACFGGTFKDGLPSAPPIKRLKSIYGIFSRLACMCVCVRTRQSTP